MCEWLINVNILQYYCDSIWLSLKCEGTARCGHSIHSAPRRRPIHSIHSTRMKRHIKYWREERHVRESFSSSFISGGVFLFCLSLARHFHFLFRCPERLCISFIFCCLKGDRLSVVSSDFYFSFDSPGFILLFSEMLQLEFSFFLIYFPLMTLLWYPFFSRCINKHLPIHTLKHHGRKTQWSSRKKHTHTYDTPTQTPWKIINLILIKCRF